MMRLRASNWRQHRVLRGLGYSEPEREAIYAASAAAALELLKAAGVDPSDLG